MTKKKWASCTKAIVSLALLGTLACAQKQTAENLDKKVQADSNQLTLAELNQRAETVIKTSPELNEDQRTKLMDLHNKTLTKSTSLREESLKLRDILLTDLTSQDYNAREVSLIKTRLKKIEDERLSLLFKAVDDANTILGHKVSSNKRILEVFDDPPVHAR